jgi:predicted nuclease of predicted toxin-antitoxin system
VTDLGLDTATDREMRDYAGEHGYSIVSKDSDFRQLAFLFGPPPKAI